MSDFVVGSIVSMWRYPVKSMLGEELNATEVMERGLKGDRAYALLDAETGAVISAKLPRKWGVLFDCRAALDPAQVKITLPDGAVVMGDAGNVDQILSQAFGREVKALCRCARSAQHRNVYARYCRYPGCRCRD